MAIVCNWFPSVIILASLGTLLFLGMFCKNVFAILLRLPCTFTSVHLVRHLGFGPLTWRLKRAFGTSEDWVGSSPQEPSGYTPSPTHCPTRGYPKSLWHRFSFSLPIFYVVRKNGENLSSRSFIFFAKRSIEFRSFDLLV